MFRITFFAVFACHLEILKCYFLGLDPKLTTKTREPISVGQRLCITLRYLVTGNAHVTIATSYRMSPTTAGRIVKETSAVI